MRNKNFPIEWKKGNPPSLPYLIRQEKGLKKINKVEPKVFKKNRKILQSTRKI
jgi:hypothetical protein